MDAKNFFGNNLFIKDLSRKLFFYNYNKKINQFVKGISQIDSIQDYELFRQYLTKIPAQVLGSTYTVKRAFAENTLYGYADSVMNYGGLENENMLYMPLLEHGIDLSDSGRIQRYVKNVSYIFQGDNKTQKWKEKMKRNAYSIGPFIYYAQDYYRDDIIESIHKKFGKTLLVFPPHSDEYGDDDFVLDAFTKTLFRIGKSYDTILVSVFWVNANDDYINYLKSNGLKLVSSGFKLDPLFVSRMKSLIKMSDTVVFPSLTTSVGYAYYLGKKVICLASDRTDAHTNLMSKIYDIKKENNRYIDKFCSIFTEDAEDRTDEMDRLIDHYWGISRIKTKEQIRNIYFENKREILRKAGF